MDTVSPVVPTRAAVDSFIQGKSRGRRAGHDALDYRQAAQYQVLLARRVERSDP
jgi:hypothetical protein